MIVIPSYCEAQLEILYSCYNGITPFVYFTIVHVLRIVNLSFRKCVLSLLLLVPFTVIYDQRSNQFILCCRPSVCASFKSSVYCRFINLHIPWVPGLENGPFTSLNLSLSVCFLFPYCHLGIVVAFWEEASQSSGRFLLPISFSSLSPQSFYGPNGCTRTSVGSISPDVLTKNMLEPIVCCVG